ncbi:PIKK family atypical protein kinase [Histomonas meleagridis]|uniref:PIKK family atypical protein kinase n=1 Tax=Histomonas meleagridis TaxID=135588 RepID=UPI00355A9B79|nr:PIKK family atypical protein kinase [Histomonas meleagridis]KAH0806689.1 PIKK family atypical protein kinase [Histomonas meleagridis]
MRAKFTIDALSAFLKATGLHPSGSLEYLCQMFSIFFRYAEYITLPDELTNDILSLPSSIVIQIIPQIVVHIAHPDENVCRIVQDLISSFSEEHFEAVVYGLNVLSLIPDKQKSKIARDFLNSLGSKHTQLFNDAQLLINGLHKCAISQCEKLISSLDSASRAHQNNNNELMKQILEEQFNSFDQPMCKFDSDFTNTYATTLKRCRAAFEQYKNGNSSNIRNMWDGLRALFVELDDKMRRLSSISLYDVNEELANKRGFVLHIPGMYSVERDSPKIMSIDPSLNVLATQQHPRSLYMTDTDGKNWKFLLKGNEDLRLDQRIMQFFYLINSLLKTNRYTVELGTLIEQYAIVPFAPNAGLISWVTGADTLQALISEHRVQRGTHPQVESEILFQQCGTIFNSLSALQRMEAFEQVSENTTADELREILWLKSPGPSSWLERNNIYTTSTALMSISGYVIGLGDRHPSNIMIQRHTGRVIHIDFGDSFEAASTRKLFPERVPFRMTRMIENALDGSTVEGLFRRSCEDILWVLREHQSPLVAQLEIFVHEPIFMSKNIAVGNAVQHTILSRVSQKLSGTDLNEEVSPEPMTVDKQVDVLLSIARDQSRYVRHYAGWCPFW